MAIDPKLHLPMGFRAAAVRAGIKPSGALDLAILASDVPCAAAGTFTTNRVCAAPVRWDRDRVPADSVRAIVVNAGNANAATGTEGEQNVRETATVAAEALGCLADQVLIASTGVIGHQLPMPKVREGVVRAAGDLAPRAENFTSAAQAIMTTDTRPKIVSGVCEIEGRPVSLLGLAKGAAMIGPRM